jgi:hypothetical protein
MEKYGLKIIRMREELRLRSVYQLQQIGFNNTASRID